MKRMNRTVDELMKLGFCTNECEYSDHGKCALFDVGKLKPAPEYGRGVRYRCDWCLGSFKR